MKRLIGYHRNGQEGYALLGVLILMLMGSLLITPLLSFMGTGIKTTTVFQTKSDELYAADAGIEDAKWQVKYDRVKSFQTPQFPQDYSPYDFSSDWPYNLSQPVNEIHPVAVSISNEWVPKNISRPDEATARGIIEGNRLVVTGRTSLSGVISQYTIKVSYSAGVNESLQVASLGVWLPPGFTYYSDSTHKSSVETLNAPYQSVPDVSDWDGNQAVIWTFSGLPEFKDFPGPTVTQGPPLTMEVSFYFKPPADQPGARPMAVAWIGTGNGANYGIPCAWDADVKVFKLHATAGSTAVESYMATSEVRKLEAAVNGDYVATGKTLMLGLDPRSNQRELLLPESTNTIDSVPAGANVDRAYLYWTGWLKQPLSGSDPAVGVFWDNGNNLDNWTAGGSWTSSGTSATDFNGRFVGHYSAGGSFARLLPMKYDVDLTGVDSATLRWNQFTAGVASTPVFQDTCSSSVNRMDYWAPDEANSDWLLAGSSYRAQHNPTTGPASKRELTSNPLDPSTYGTTGLVRISWKINKGSQTQNTDGLDFAYSLDNGNSWNTSQVFRGSGTPVTSVTLPSMTLAAGFRIRFNLIDYGSANVNRYCEIDDINISVSNDALYCDLSHDGGTTWPTRIPVFSGGDPATPFSYDIPSAYWNSHFRVRFYVDGFDQAGEYVYLDNIGVMVTSAAITARPADNTVTFSINGGVRHIIAADSNDPAQVQSQVKDGPPSAEPPDGYYYGCRVDVTDLVRNESNGVNVAAIPPVYGNGNAVYTVAGVYADSLKVDGTTYGSASFAGWSLVIVYSSPDTKGHQLFLYDLKDTFQSVPATVPDSPPMQVSGFVVPARVGNETEVARLTMFVGEGDIQITGDYIAIVDQHDATEHPLWDGVDLSSDGNSQGSPRNVWNGRSTGSTASEAGVDVDTFHVLWSDNILLQGDTGVQLNMHTYGDGYVTVYKILSFRSAIVPGGSLGYEIR